MAAKRLRLKWWTTYWPSSQPCNADLARTLCTLATSHSWGRTKGQRDGITSARSERQAQRPHFSRHFGRSRQLQLGPGLHHIRRLQDPQVLHTDHHAARLLVDLVRQDAHLRHATVLDAVRVQGAVPCTAHEEGAGDLFEPLERLGFKGWTTLMGSILHAVQLDQKWMVSAAKLRNPCVSVALVSRGKCKYKEQ